ncbi:MAG: peptidoglycan-associated lipoprotein Pal [Betaproteobacteria bacterium]
MRSILIAFAAVAGLAACSSTPEDEQKPAAVEERQQGAAQPGATTQPVKPGGVARVDLTGAGKTPARAPHNDPGNILSRRSIYYDLDQYTVKDQYRELVEAHARYLRANPQLKMLLQGNTDERGSREYNIGLGQRRSDGLKKMLMLLGVKEEQVEAVSLGEEKPSDQGRDEAAWSKNRRSDILYSGEF